jgi:prohibitin 1
MTCVPAGSVGVIDVFGKVRDYTLKPGITFPINPFASVIKMSSQTMEAKEEDFTVTTKEGLAVGLDVSVWYALDQEKALLVYKTIGNDYVKKILHPAIRGILRDAISEHTCDDLYNIQKRQEAAKKAEELLKVELTQRGINIDRVLLRDVQFPPQVKDAIDRKMAAKQAAEQMQYVLQKVEQEAEQKRVEAKGIADAQVIITKGITHEYLQWKYIEELRALAASPNATFVILPFDSKLVPMMDVKTGDMKLIGETPKTPDVEQK